ncbi:MAG: TolC family protein, partial [Ignavibacteriales bacterium]|nr:TolC family protein [Ignavibacteriales bacterium]
AGSLDDPQFNYKLMEFPGTQFSQAVYQNFELMQMIMFPTKLFLRRNIAEIRAEHAHHDHLEKEIEILSRLKSAYAMLWAARTNLEINRENQRLLSQILRSAETQYAVGKASQQDVLKTNIELAKLKTQEASIQQEIISAESMMRAILNRPHNAPIGALAYDSLAPVQHSVEDLIAFALLHRPMIVHDSLSVTEGELMLSMSKQEYLPDFRVSLERVTMPIGGMSSWSFSAGISIPFAPWSLSKAASRVEEAEAERLMRSSLYQASQNMVEAQIREAHAKVKSLEVQVTALERTIIPQSYQSLLSALTEYQTGRTPYLMLLDGFRMYQEFKMDAVMARMHYEQAVASLERQVGVVTLDVVPEVSKEN